MTHREQQDHLETELKGVIRRFIKEYDMTLADAIGTLEVVKLWLYMDQTAEPEEGEGWK